MKLLNNVGTLVGRILLATIFLLMGAMKFQRTVVMAAYMRFSGVPVSAVKPLLYASAIIEIVGGLLVLIGFRTREATLLLFP